MAALAVHRADRDRDSFGGAIVATAGLGGGESVSGDHERAFGAAEVRFRAEAEEGGRELKGISFTRRLGGTEGNEENFNGWDR